MEYVCDAPGGKTWFRIAAEPEAAQESIQMNHAVEKYFRREQDKAIQSYRSPAAHSIERDIGRAAHIAREMALFLTLRDREGTALATAMLPPQARSDSNFRIVIVGPSNGDPYIAQGDAIAALGAHYGLKLDRESCFPYSRAPI